MSDRKCRFCGAVALPHPDEPPYIGYGGAGELICTRACLPVLACGVLESTPELRARVARWRWEQTLARLTPPRRPDPVTGEDWTAHLSSRDYAVRKGEGWLLSGIVRLVPSSHPGAWWAWEVGTSGAVLCCREADLDAFQAAVRSRRQSRWACRQPPTFVMPRLTGRSGVAP